MMAGYESLLGASILFSENEDNNTLSKTESDIKENQIELSKSNINLINNIKANYQTKNKLITPKTCVAIGLLNLLDGEATGFVERLRDPDVKKESPFNFYVGKIKQGFLRPTLRPKFQYKSWSFLDIVKETCITKLVWTDDPLVEQEKKVNYKKIDIVHEDCFKGKAIFLSPIAPKRIVLAIRENEHSEENLFEESIDLE